MRFALAFVGEVRRKQTVLREFEGACDRPPSSGLDNIFMNPGGYGALLSECVGLGVTPQQLVALATVDVPETSFGDLENINGHAAAIAAKQTQLRELCEQAAHAITLDDFIFEPIDVRLGTFRRRFAIANVVANEPLPAAVEQLVGQLARQ